MPSWDYDPICSNEIARAFEDKPAPWKYDPDAVEVPDPYTTDEWGNTEGARVQAEADVRRDRVTIHPFPGYGRVSVRNEGLDVDPAPFIDGWYNRDPE